MTSVLALRVYCPHRGDFITYPPGPGTNYGQLSKMQRQAQRLGLVEIVKDLERRKKICMTPRPPADKVQRDLF